MILEYKVHNGMVLDYKQGVGIVRFNLATPGDNTPEMRPLTAYVLTYTLKTEAIENYLKRGAKLHPGGFSV